MKTCHPSHNLRLHRLQTPLLLPKGAFSHEYRADLAGAYLPVLSLPPRAPPRPGLAFSFVQFCKGCGRNVPCFLGGVGHSRVVLARVRHPR